MRVSALYDIHANLPALEAVLADVRRAGVDRIIIGGDVVPGPMPRDTMALLRSVPCPVSFIQGNGEVAVFAERIGTYSEHLPAQARTLVRWTVHALSREDALTLESWPMLVTLAIDGIGPVLFCHGTPRHHNEIMLATTADALIEPVLEGLEASLVVCGHTHMPFDRVVGDTRIVNPGSVGMPFGDHGADWLLLGPDVELRRTTYDYDDAARRVRESDYIDRDSFSAQILQPPPAAQMLAAFAAAEMRYSRDA